MGFTQGLIILEGFSESQAAILTERDDNKESKGGYEQTNHQQNRSHSTANKRFFGHTHSSRRTENIPRSVQRACSKYCSAPMFILLQENGPAYEASLDPAQQSFYYLLDDTTKNAGVALYTYSAGSGQTGCAQAKTYTSTPGNSPAFTGVSPQSPATDGLTLTPNCTN